MTGFDPRPRLAVGLLLVFLGGTVGAGLREALALVGTGSWPPFAMTLVVNLAGSGALGLLYGLLGTVVSPRAQRLRLLWGTGVCGGFTTYSAVSAQVVATASWGEPIVAVAYALATVAGCAVLALAGVLLGEHLAERRRGGRI